MAKTALVTARVDPVVKQKLQALAESTQRSESFLAKEAIEAYVETNDWQVALIKDLLTATSFRTTCPFKGEASYWSLDMDGETLDGLVWSYEDPIPGSEGISGLLSFYPDRVELTVDGEPVT